MATKSTKQLQTITAETATNNLNLTVGSYKVAKETSIHDALLLASTMDKKKGEIYLEVSEMIRSKYPWKIERKDGITSFAWPEKFKLAPYLAAQFPEFPKVAEVDADGKKTGKMINLSLPEAMKEVGSFGSKAAAAVHAVNRFSVWFSGYKLQLITAYNRSLAEAEKSKLAETPMNEENRKANEQHIDRLYGLSREPGERTAGRVIDMKGNIKEDNIKALSSETRGKLIQALATENPEQTAKVLSVVTGKKVQVAEKIEDLRARQLLERLEAIASSEFSAPSTALELIAQLKGMLIEDKATAVAGKPAGKAKAKAVKTANAA